MYCTTDVLFPSGAELNRNIDGQKRGRGDLSLPDGRLIARDVQRLCWNEAAIWGWGKPEAFIRPGGEQEVIYASYFTGMIGPGLLYDGMKAPFLPPCHWRNTGNPSLRHRDWFARACTEDAPAARRPAPSGQ